MTSAWTTAGITCLVLGMSGLEKSPKLPFPNRLIPAAIMGLAPVCWALSWDLHRAAGYYSATVAAGQLWFLAVATAVIARGRPANVDEAAPPPRHPKAWRWFTAVYLVVSVSGTVSIIRNPSKLTAFDWLSLPIDALVVAGLCSYAFQRRLLPTSFWRVIAPAYLIWAVSSFAMHCQPMMAALAKPNSTAVSLMASAIVLPLVIGLPALSVLALLRLSWFPPRQKMNVRF